MSKPSIVIIPGAWQKPAAFAGIVDLLNETGYPTVHVPLPTVGGTETPLAGLDDDVAAVRAVLAPLVEQHARDVVLIGHSSGGISMSAVAEGLDAASRTAAGKTGGVVRCVYLAAFVLPKGQSLLGMLGGQPLPWMVLEVSCPCPCPLWREKKKRKEKKKEEADQRMSFVLVQGDRVTGHPDMVVEVGFNDLSPEEQSKWSKEMTHSKWNSSSCSSCRRRHASSVLRQP